MAKVATWTGGMEQVGDRFAPAGWRFLRVNFTHNGTEIPGAAIRNSPTSAPCSPTPIPGTAVVAAVLRACAPRSTGRIENCSRPRCWPSSATVEAAVTPVYGRRVRQTEPGGTECMAWITSRSPRRRRRLPSRFPTGPLDADRKSTGKGRSSTTGPDSGCTRLGVLTRTHRPPGPAGHRTSAGTKAPHWSRTARMTHVHVTLHAQRLAQWGRQHHKPCPIRRGRHTLGAKELDHLNCSKAPRGH